MAKCLYTLGTTEAGCRDVIYDWLFTIECKWIRSFRIMNIITSGSLLRVRHWRERQYAHVQGPTKMQDSVEVEESARFHFRAFKRRAQLVTKRRWAFFVSVRGYRYAIRSCRLGTRIQEAQNKNPTYPLATPTCPMRRLRYDGVHSVLPRKGTYMHYRQCTT